ncbi:Fe-S cluster assembly iron-binding protein IscA [Alkaliphilus hydrothermalis]|uniref:Fe-S cluster assembly iron-binding protein IscA n=1 Tax=Alkaliphilus hydrothermalis TaxID=1482730 RepID=A0ABS2NQE2_9FIRM|nr:Fe-S cluster assembly iron-binding protein IscA [Alkaliphilus hydrothermalis]
MNITISKTAKETIATQVKEDQKIRIHITGQG